MPRRVPASHRDTGQRSARGHFAGPAVTVRPMRPAVTFALLATIALAGCSVSITHTIDSGKAQRAATHALETGVGARIRSVTCPGGIKEKKGEVFRCTVVATDGTRGAVTFRQTNGKGNVHLDAPYVHPREVEQAMTTHFAALLSTKVSVRCPELIPVGAGRRFTCHATASGSTAEIDAVETDAAGHFTYRAKNTTGG